MFVDDADLGQIVLVPLSKFFPHLGNGTAIESDGLDLGHVAPKRSPVAACIVAYNGAPLNVSAGRGVSSRLVGALTLCPIDLAFTADGGRNRVLHLEPLIGAAREIGRAELLANHALTAERASVLVDDRTVAVVSRIERDAVVRCP